VILLDKAAKNAQGDSLIAMKLEELKNKDIDSLSRLKERLRGHQKVDPAVQLNQKANDPGVPDQKEAAVIVEQTVELQVAGESHEATVSAVSAGKEESKHEVAPVSSESFKTDDQSLLQRRGSRRLRDQK